MPLKSGEANSVLGNLIDNAIEAAESAPGERRVSNVEIIKPSNAFVFTVANRGKPIEPEIIDRIFEPDFSTKKGRPGLGLAIVKELVERYKGSAAVTSNDEETVFTVLIPDKKMRID